MSNNATQQIVDKARPEPDVLAQEIADDLQTALEQFVSIAAELKR